MLLLHLIHCTEFKKIRQSTYLTTEDSKSNSHIRTFIPETTRDVFCPGTVHECEPDVFLFVATTRFVQLLPLLPMWTKDSQIKRTKKDAPANCSHKEAHLQTTNFVSRASILSEDRIRFAF